MPGSRDLREDRNVNHRLGEGSVSHHLFTLDDGRRELIPVVSPGLSLLQFGFKVPCWGFWDLDYAFLTTFSSLLIALPVDKSSSFDHLLDSGLVA